jgi:hypothetical protein
MTDTENLDLQLKQLEVDKRREEIRQLRSSSKRGWITPAALAAFLPMVLWGLNMAKDYTAGIRALAQVDGLKQERALLAQQKNELNEEIVALLALKQHYREETVVRQEAIDKTYLRGKFTSDELFYALSLMQGIEPLSAEQTRQLAAEKNNLSAEARPLFDTLLRNYDFAQTVIKIADDLMTEVRGTFDLMSPSSWTKPYRSTLTGQFGNQRRLLVAEVAGAETYYDIDLGRTLTDSERAALR